MPRPLPTSDIFSFRAPIVKEGSVCVAVKTLDVDWHGLRMSRAVARQMGEALLAAADAREPRKNSPERKSADEFAAAAPAGGSPS